MKIAITSIQRNRNPYIVEWIAFHLSVGFNQFYLYCHKTDDGMTETLLQLAQKYPIQVFKMNMDDFPQISAYQHAWSNFGDSVDWMAFIDGDEFLFPSQHRIMEDALRSFESFQMAALGVYWKCYGSNGHVSDPTGLIVENYPRHSKSDFLPNRHIKSIAKGGSAIHPNRSHFFESSLGTFDEQLRPITNGLMEHLEPSYNFFRINHYAIQSREYYFTVKHHQDAADLPAGTRRSDAFFDAHDRNEECDGVSELLLPALRCKHSELMAYLSQYPSTARKEVGRRTEAKVFQIYYSPETQSSSEPGFLPLDNLSNERPDWREYWPIRQYLKSNSLESDTYYGFFSPKFRQKTGLTTTQVFAFIEAQNPGTDVVLFSPFFDQSAFPINQFEQGAAQHGGIFGAFEKSVNVLSPGLDISKLIMHSKTTVFCNYFVAKPRFWEAWLTQCEIIYSIAEDGKSELAHLLNALTNHDRSSAPVKVFVIERIASLLLATQKQWQVAAYDSTQLPYSTAPIANYRSQLILLDALKIAAQLQPFDSYLSSYFNIREAINQMIQTGSP